MKQDKQKRKWILDAVLFGGFLVALWLDLTGLALHQWLGIAVGALAGYHLIAHWTWVEAVTSRIFGRANRQSRQFYAVDAGLAVGFATIAVTGLVISTWFDLGLASYAIWRNVHVLASVVTLALVVAKIGLHWRWIVSTARRRIFPTPAPLRKTEPVPVAVQIGRRDFVRLMAGVGAVALLAGVNVLDSSDDGQSVASDSQVSGGTQVLTATSTTSTSGACTIRCGKRCSYPGHCRKYTDSNNNGRCDLGECLS